MRIGVAWHVTATLLLLHYSHVICQTLAARPEDAVFVPGTLPLDDTGKEVICPLDQSLLIYDLRSPSYILFKASLYWLMGSSRKRCHCRSKHMEVGY